VNAVNTGPSRNLAKIKSKWGDLCTAAKKKEIYNRIQAAKTGGSGLEPMKLEVYEERVIHVEGF
jgi:hypothetical protein